MMKGFFNYYSVKLYSFTTVHLFLRQQKYIRLKQSYWNKIYIRHQTIQRVLGVGHGGAGVVERGCFGVARVWNRNTQSGIVFSYSQYAYYNISLCCNILYFIFGLIPAPPPSYSLGLYFFLSWNKNAPRTLVFTNLKKKSAALPVDVRLLCGS